MTKPEYDVRISLDDRPTYLHEVVAESRRFIEQLRIRDLLDSNRQPVTADLLRGSSRELDFLLNPLRKSITDLGSGGFTLRISGVYGVRDLDTFTRLMEEFFRCFYTIIGRMGLGEMVGVDEEKTITFSIQQSIAHVGNEIDRLEKIADFLAARLPDLNDRHSQSPPSPPPDPYETRLIVNLDEPDANDRKASFIFNGEKYSAPLAVCVWLEGLRRERGGQIGKGEIQKGFTVNLATELDGVEAGDLWKKLPDILKPLVINGPKRNKGYSLNLRQNP